MPSVRPTSYPIPSPSPNYSSSSSTTTATASASASASASDRSPPMSDEDGSFPSPRTSPPSQTSKDLLPLPPPPASVASRASPFPVREDCWSEDATRTLIDAWGSHYLELNRGSLRQKHWQEVADAVNAAHGHNKKLRRTDVQCKNRIDTLKKKYKVEKFKAIQSKGRFYSDWPFFTSLDSLIGESFIKSKPSSASPPATRRSSARNAAASQAPVPLALKRDFPALPPPPSAVPVGPRSKRPAPMGSGAEETMYRRNFLVAAAPVEEDADDDDEVSETSTPLATARVRPRSSGMGRVKRRAFSGDVTAEGYRKLGEAIRGFAVIYERIEVAKQKQMVELEKQRMQFAKDLEIQRMKLFMESQVQLEKLKRSTPNASQSGGY